MAAKKKAGKKPFGGKTVAADVLLAKIIGKGKHTPPQMTKKLWAYFKSNKLIIKTATGPFGGMKIKPDENLKAVGVKGTVPPTTVFKNIWAYIKKHNLLH